MNPWWLDATLGFVGGRRHKGPWREGFRVLAYHGVVERKKDRLLEQNFRLLGDFRRHLRLLRRYHVISLAELADELGRATFKHGPIAVITFDDGYTNNLLAAEVLAEFRLPWSLFIPTGTVGRERFIWTAELSLLLLAGQSSRIEVLDKTWSLKERSERESAFQEIRRALKAMPSTPRRDAMEFIRQQFPAGETLRLLDEFDSLQMLSWQEIGHLRSSGVEIGSHGVDHEIHHNAQPEYVRWRELTESKTVLEQKLADSCRFFAYPNGDFVATSAKEVGAAGYELAVTTEPGIVGPDTNPHLVPRTEPADSLQAFTKQFFWPHWVRPL